MQEISWLVRDMFHSWILGRKWRQGVILLVGSEQVYLLLHYDEIARIYGRSSLIKFEHRYGCKLIVFAHHLVIYKHSMGFSGHSTFTKAISRDVSWIFWELSFVAILYNFSKFVYLVEYLTINIIEERYDAIVDWEPVVFKYLLINNSYSFE